ncbi:hypothetical protein BD626DRAFT_566456 [Schizophyllum amplum]|uniref:Uncharacterized protein n=1 Tax=Schizophyllum amplum TaxID=97359 RepID=A0A550CLW4_9AGAR|nr:hypothetical protein BD626DRAFT_566456 [Auriculariopsis ampla]
MALNQQVLDYSYPLVYQPKQALYKGRPLRNGFARLGDYKDVHDERAAHEAAMFVLSRKNRPLPASLEEMRTVAAKHRRLNKSIQQATLEEVQARLVAVMEAIQARKQAHARDMKRLYEWHAAVYRDEAEDMRRSKDDDNLRSRDAVSKLYAQSRLRRSNPTVRAFTSVVAQHRWAYLKAMLPLQREIKDLEEARIRKEEARRVEEARRLQEQDRLRMLKEKAFPTSIEDYHSKPPHIQRLVREFLTETVPARRQRMIQTQSWSKPATDHMLGVMQNSEVFRMVVAAEKLKDTMATAANVSRDPRLRR